MADKSYQDYIDSAGGANTGLDLAEGLLGGPVGWYELASGQRLGAQNQVNSMFGANGVNTHMTKDVYDTMSSDDWKAFNQMSSSDQNAWINQRMADVQQGKVKQAGQDKVNQQEAAYQQWRSDTLTKLQGFADKMNMSVDQLIKSGDAGAQLAQNTGLRAASQQALGAGVGDGGISALNSQKVVQDSLNNYQFQRAQAGATAYNNLQQGLGSMAHDAESIRQYNQGLDLQMQQARNMQYQSQYAQGQNQMSSIGGLIGSFWGPAGSKVGAAVGSAGYGASNTYSPPGYGYPSSSGGGLGGYSPNAYKPSGSSQ